MENHLTQLYGTLASTGYHLPEGNTMYFIDRIKLIFYQYTQEMQIKLDLVARKERRSISTVYSMLILSLT